MLHITNGTSPIATMREGGIEGEIIAWIDVLHEGPVPAGYSLDELRTIRARFIADQGWGSYEDVFEGFSGRDTTLAHSTAHDEVILWFEHDLYDQLQLIQLLDWFAQRNLSSTNLSLICINEYLGRLTAEKFPSLFRHRRKVSSNMLRLGQRAWKAFRSPDPREIISLLENDSADLPFLNGALHRHLEQFPSIKNGLSRSESQALEEISKDRFSMKEVFLASHHGREESIFLGDVVFATYLEQLGKGCSPLVLFEDGSRVQLPNDKTHVNELWNKRVALTATGKKVLEAREDWICINGIDKWLGGVHLIGNDPEWRWDTTAHRLRYRDEG